MAKLEEVTHHDDGGNADTVLSALKSKELLVPAALSAAGALAAAKGPDLVHRLTESTEEKTEQLGEKAAEGAKKGLTEGKPGVAGKVLSKALPGGGSGGSGGKKTRRLPIQRWTDVAVSVDKAYAAWIDFDSFPKFMHRVQRAQEKGRDKIRFDEKIWFSKRQWEAQITDRRRNDRIAWKTTTGTSHRGVISFHKLDDNLTRVMVDMEFEPSGMLEKMASGLRFVKRAVQSDLARFKAHVEMQDAKGIEYRSDSQAEREESRREREQGRKERRDSTNGS